MYEEVEIPVVLHLLFPGKMELSLAYSFAQLPEVDETELLVVPKHPLLAPFGVSDDTITEDETFIFVYINAIGEATILRGPLKGHTIPRVTCSVVPLPEEESQVNLN